MAQGTSLNQSRLTRGFIALAILVVFAGAALVSILSSGLSTMGGVWTENTVTILRFTLIQAFLSTTLSVGLAIPVAFALDQCRAFPGRIWVIGLFALPLSLPTIVGVLALLSLLGRNGLLANMLATLGISAKPDIYGLTGILIAHVFFNLPLAARLLLNALDTVPEAHWKLAESLRFSTYDRFRRLCWPVMRHALPGTAGLIFLLCVTSFAIVLILGGGPSATTLEVAIYQALTYDLDLGRAASLTLLQIALVGLVLFGFRFFGLLTPNTVAHNLRLRRFARLSMMEVLMSGGIIAVAALFIAAPFATIIYDGIYADHWRILTSKPFVQALLTSLTLSALSASLAVTLSLALVAATHATSKINASFSIIFSIAPNLILAFPPIILGAGWFILAAKFGNPYQSAAFLVVAVNAAMSLPFAVRILEPAFLSAANRHDRLCQSLRISGLARIRLIDFPTMRRSIVTAFLFAMALSLGDLGVIALFGSDGILTLPALLFAKMGSYRLNDAAGLALYLMVITVGLTIIANFLQGTGHDK